jgi:SSS family solute:Na+ symporter
MFSTSRLELLDVTVIAVYFGAILAAGLLFRNRIGGTNDYFAAGGNMLWWMAGFSALTSELSVWGFTGAAGRYSSEGLLLLYANFVSYLTLPLLFWLGPRFRRLRVTTGLESVGLRFGSTTETFYSLLVIPLGVWSGAMGIHVTAVFFSAATGVDKNLIVLVVGGFIVIVSALGGIWAISTSDLFQGMLTLFMMIVLLLLVASHPSVAAAGGFWKSMPRDLLNPFSHTTPFTVVTWVSAMTAVTLLGRLSVMHDGAKFIIARSEVDCRRMVGVFLVIGLFMTPLIAFPSILASTVLGPELLGQAETSSEGVIAHLASAILPAGLMGLMLAAIVAAAMNSMDQTLNRNAGFFVTSIYQRFFRPETTTVESIRVSRIATVVSGSISMVIALILNANRESGLFDFVLRANSLLTIPLMVPIALGIVFRKAPSWAGWGGALVCTAVAWLSDAFVSAPGILSFAGIEAVGPRDLVDLKLAVQIFLTLIAGLLVFGVGHLSERSRRWTAASSVGAPFWSRWNDPVLSEGSAETDRLQRVNAGRILFGFGLAIACLLPFLKLGRESIWVLGLVLCFAVPGAILLRNRKPNVG